MGKRISTCGRWLVDADNRFAANITISGRQFEIYFEQSETTGYTAILTGKKDNKLNGEKYWMRQNELGEFLFVDDIKNGVSTPATTLDQRNVFSQSLNDAIAMFNKERPTMEFKKAS